MSAVLRCLDAGQNALLESPTGTGKTLSLLCSTLAWLERTRADQQLKALMPAADAGPVTEWSPPVRHKIIYSSRTHSQLSQAVSELARTSYRYMKVAILGSRDQLCVNPAVMEAPTSREKLHMCQARVKAKTCIFKTNVEKAKEDRIELRDNTIMDIEDLHKLGAKHSFCPYYMSRELYQSADIIFLPYNYLLEDSIRNSLDIDFNGAVIIFDEAHNVQKLCEEASSFSIGAQDLALALKDIDDAVEMLKNPEPSFDDSDMAPKDLREQDLLIIKDSLLELEGSFGLLLKGKESRVEKGSFARSVFASFIDPAVVKCLDLLVEYLSNLASAAFSTKGRGVTKLLDFLRGAFNEQVKLEDLETLYKVYVMVEKGKGENGNKANSFLKSKSENVVFNLWCFSPGFSMQRLSKLGPRSIILTSGTLSPLQCTAEEVGIPFPVQLENKHVVEASQVWCGVLAAGIDKTPLNSSFKTRSDPKYINSLGMTVISLIKMVPAGVLIFFPSYSLLNSTREFWQNCGIWSRIDQVKRIMVEPQRKEALGLVMSDYYAEVKGGRGAVFMAVCRGKVAEGLDFADDNGRAVLVLGLPYPPFKDPRIELKRQFLDDQVRAKSGTLAGSKWYQLEAFRATNQCIGRVIRHSRDHGAVIFLDARFGDQMARQSLSKWLQPFFQKYDSPLPATKALAQFFKTDGEVCRLRKAVVEEKLAAVAASRSKRRPHIEMELEHEQEVRPCGPLAKDYVGSENFLEVHRRPAVQTDSVPRASDIYSTSSSAISFSRGAYQNQQKTPLLPIPHQLALSQHANKVAVQGSTAPKRKKIKLMSNPSLFPTTATVEEAANGEIRPGGRPESEMLVEYVTGLKKLLGKELLAGFTKALKAYKTEDIFGVLVPMLESVIVPNMKVQPTLLKDFRTFVKKNHRNEFDAFLEKHSTSDQ